MLDFVSHRYTDALWGLTRLGKETFTLEGPEGCAGEAMPSQRAPSGPAQFLLRKPCSAVCCCSDLPGGQLPPSYNRTRGTVIVKFAGGGESGRREVHIERT